MHLEKIYPMLYFKIVRIFRAVIVFGKKKNPGIIDCIFFLHALVRNQCTQLYNLYKLMAYYKDILAMISAKDVIA